jgi:RHS repeat-associated protein
MEQLDSGTSTALYTLSDGLGSSRGVANSSGAIAGSSDYDVFGAVRSQNGASSIFGFTGQQTDATGMLYLRARYLNTVLGRFLSPDSLLPNGPGSSGYNLYSYVGNNATTMVDPSGHLTIEWATIVRSVVLTAGAVAIGLALRNIYQASVCALSAGSICAPGYFPPRARGGSGGGGGTTAADELANQLLRAVAQLTKAAATAAAAACLASAVAGRLAPWGSTPCSGLKGPIFFSGSDNRETTNHIADAQSTGGKLAILSYWGPNRPPSKWYDSTPFCDPPARTLYASRSACDEYPFHSTNQNRESLATVSLQLVPFDEASIQGTALSIFYAPYGCRVSKGDEFAVVPVVVPVNFPVPVPSFGYCPSRP